jgi:hypothetical protein
MGDVRAAIAQIATIDCTLITIETEGGNHFGFDTANQIQVEPQIETEDAVTLIVKGVLRAQKAQKDTLTGHEITLSDNLFNPELIAILQGGTVTHDPQDPSIITGYTPPLAGSRDKGEIFTLHAYTAQFDTSSQVVQYERLSYPNCQGRPVSFSSEDGAFRAPEYTIFSAPRVGEAPYTLTYVPDLPVIVGQVLLPALTVTSVAGAAGGKTTITVTPTASANNSYMYKLDTNAITLPLDRQTVTEYTVWDGTIDITAITGQYIAVVEVDTDNRAVAGGQTTVTATD